MATRQRLTAVLDARRASRPCWRCALDLSRYSSTNASSGNASLNNTHETTHDKVVRWALREELKPVFRSRRLKTLRTEASSEDGLSKPGDGFRIRKIVRPERAAQLSEEVSNDSVEPDESDEFGLFDQSDTSNGRFIHRLDTSVFDKESKDERATDKRSMDESVLGDDSSMTMSQLTALASITKAQLAALDAHRARLIKVLRERSKAFEAKARLQIAKEQRIRFAEMRRRKHFAAKETVQRYKIDNSSSRDHGEDHDDIGAEKRSQERLSVTKGLDDSDLTKGIDASGRPWRYVEFEAPLVRTLPGYQLPSGHPGEHQPPLERLSGIDASGPTWRYIPFDSPSSPRRTHSSQWEYRGHHVSSEHPEEHQLPPIRQVPYTDISIVLTSLLEDFSDQLPLDLDPSSFRFPQNPKLMPRSTLISSQFSGSRSSLGSRMPLRQSVSFSETTQIRTLMVESRPYATVASQTVQTNSPVDQSDIGTNPDKALKARTGGIREVLRMWQEQHENALIDTSSRNSPTTIGETKNLLNQSGEDESFTTVSREDEADEEDDADVDSDEPASDIFAQQVYYRRGDLVELLTGSEHILAVFVRNVADQCQFYTIRGEWVNRQAGNARFAVSRFVDPNDLNDILPHLPDEEVTEDRMDCLFPIDAHAPRDAGAKVIKQMSLFHQAADAAFRKHAERIDRIYDIIAPIEESRDRTYMSLKDIAMKVLKTENPLEITQPLMWTIHKALSATQNVLWLLLSSRQNPIYEILPQQGLKYIHLVREWVREYQENIIQDVTNQVTVTHEPGWTAPTSPLNPIAAFVQKARFAIRQSRQTRPLSKTGFIGPSLTRSGVRESTFREIRLSKFDDNDKIIIHYLNVWATSAAVNKFTDLGSLGPMVLRATGMYEGFELDRPKGFTLLQEIGVITPWANRTIFKSRGLNLLGLEGDENAKLSRGALDVRAELGNQISAPKDSMEGLRKDWGDMPVFCIDSADTVDRDDGISLELVDDNSSTYWVHVHVANPSAFIAPDSAMAKHAAEVTESVYFPEKKHAMLSSEMIQDRLSLANDRPCITFSAKMSADGDALEKTITPGIVRNVHYYTPTMVGRGLGLIETDEKSHMVSLLNVGGRIPTQLTKDSDQASQALTDPEHIKALKKLFEIGTASFRKKIQNGAPDFYSTAIMKTMSPMVYAMRSAGKLSLIEDRSVRQFEGDPIISLQASTEIYSHISHMLSNLMVIAGDVCASWCSDRNIPIPYRGILRNPEPASSPEVFKRQVLEPKIAEYGHADRTDLRRYMRLVGQAHASAQPLPHFTLGLPAYCKITSPLRRYVDLYVHWQVEAAIRYESATGTSLVGRTDSDSHLPFSRAQVAEYAAETLQRERLMAMAKTSSRRHWTCQALFRALYFDEAPLPETFRVRVASGWKERFAPGWCEGWEFRALLEYGEPVERKGGWQVGDLWETRLEDVDPYSLKIIMEPIRLLSRERVEEKEVDG